MGTIHPDCHCFDVRYFWLHSELVVAKSSAIGALLSFATQAVLLDLFLAYRISRAPTYCQPVISGSNGQMATDGAWLRTDFYYGTTFVSTCAVRRFHSNAV